MTCTHLSSGWDGQHSSAEVPPFSPKANQYGEPVRRCLKPAGRFVSVSFSSPLLRKRLFARSEYDWSIQRSSYVHGFEYYVYVMTKGEELSPEDAALEKTLLEDTESPPAAMVSTQMGDEEDEEEEENFLFNMKF
ncbi:hypothetical protein EYF80_021945 [Liparis tanakae]|uniref:Uncharacterized protein n=1 Tax=Liparis tanakae TaxID=230148 RepID=A0A4Z2HQD2_9TELE|nr:hypothetical protein EYF80_021945 [Liparis tanakae]